MIFHCTVDIDLPVEKVVEKFDNVHNNEFWQDNFLRREHISGSPGASGAKSKLFYQQGKKEMELVETILVKNLPDEMTALYEHTQMTNTMKSNFIPLSKTQTRWYVEINYTEFHSFIPKLMSLFMPWVFKKQTQKWLDQFKVFCEKRDY